jgi:hypothetical protein
MTAITKILLAAALLCFLAWGAVLAVGLQPLTAASGVQVIYGEQEDFFSDAVVYRGQGNGLRYLVYAPRARPAYRWWFVDFKELMIRRIEPPRTIGSRIFVLKRDLVGTNVADRDVLGDWNWHFADGGAAFSGNGFTCSVRRIGNN